LSHKLKLVKGDQYILKIRAKQGQIRYIAPICPYFLCKKLLKIRANKSKTENRRPISTKIVEILMAPLRFIANFLKYPNNQSKIGLFLANIPSLGQCPDNRDLWQHWFYYSRVVLEHSLGEGEFILTPYRLRGTTKLLLHGSETIPLILHRTE